MRGRLMVGQWPLKPLIPGSSPGPATIFEHGSRNGAASKNRLLGDFFVGSTP